MVAQVGCQYKKPFRGERGITKGDILSPTIFNVAVNVVVRHWGALVEERAGGDISDDDGNMAQPQGRTTWERYDRRRQAQEMHARITVKADFVCGRHTGGFQ